MSGKSGPRMADDVLRLCLDTHLLVALKFNKRSTPRSQSIGPDSHYETSSYFLMFCIENGGNETAAIQMVVSLGMLDDMADSLESLGFRKESAMAIADGMAGMAQSGPKLEEVHLVLGGTGLMALGHSQQTALETALAGRAHVLATNAVSSYVTEQTHAEVLERSERRGVDLAEVAIYSSADRSVVIALPHKVARWLKDGIFPDAETIRALYPGSPQLKP